MPPPNPPAKPRPLPQDATSGLREAQEASLAAGGPPRASYAVVGVDPGAHMGLAVVSRPVGVRVTGLAWHGPAQAEYQRAVAEYQRAEAALHTTRFLPVWAGTCSPEELVTELRVAITRAQDLDPFAEVWIEGAAWQGPERSRGILPAAYAAGQVWGIAAGVLPVMRIHLATRAEALRAVGMPPTTSKGGARRAVEALVSGASTVCRDEHQRDAACVAVLGLLRGRG